MLERAWGIANLLHCWWNVNWYGHYGEQYGVSFKNQNQNYHMTSNPTPGRTAWENQNSQRHTRPSVLCSTITTARTQTQPKCPATDKQLKRCNPKSFNKNAIVCSDAVFPVREFSRNEDPFYLGGLQDHLTTALFWLLETEISRGTTIMG